MHPHIQPTKSPIPSPEQEPTLAPVIDIYTGEQQTAPSAGLTAVINSYDLASKGHDQAGYHRGIAIDSRTLHRVEAPLLPVSRTRLQKIGHAARELVGLNPVDGSSSSPPRTNTQGIEQAAKRWADTKRRTQ